ncbi:MAG: hypothetical protein ACYDDA_10080 [Acidiferrobacteraceae bacterium]
MQAELRSLAPEAAEAVARHLVAAGFLIDTDPLQALAHARAARRRAARVASVREALGLTAYACAEYALARAELRAARRIGGGADTLPVLADCERALGHPEHALAVAADPAAATLDPAGRAELAIVVAGARRDLGQPEAALAVLRRTPGGPEDTAVSPWSARLWYAYADALLAAGRAWEASRWFVATATIDEDGDTDAAERAAALSAADVSLDT